MSDEDYFTEKEFNAVREKILKLFDGELSNYFTVKKSTYKWSLKNSWRINVAVTRKWNSSGDNSPKTILRVVSMLFQIMSEFIENDDNGFYFKNVESRVNFGYNFVFIPKVIAAKRLLSDARF